MSVKQTRYGQPKMVNGTPISRFYLEVKESPESEIDIIPFTTKWEAGDAHWRNAKKGYEVVAYSWNGEDFEEDTETIKEVGITRAARYSGNKKVRDDIPVPQFSGNVLRSNREFAELVKSVCVAGKADQLDDDTRRTSLESAIEFIFTLGLETKDIKSAVNGYISSHNSHKDKAE